MDFSTQALIVLLHFVLLFPIDGKSAEAGRTIYGLDNRQDLYALQDSQPLAWAKTTVGLVKNRRLRIDQNLVFLDLINYQQKHNLCSTERFIEQGTLPFCTGVLIAPNQILTVGHCVQTENQCSETSFIFDFALFTPTPTPDQLELNNVFSCKKILTKSLTLSGAGYVVLETDRPVSNDRTPLTLSQSPPLVKTPLVLIGHPSGLPTKVADGAKVREVLLEQGIFIANTDSYRGNSGSPVINPQTQQIEGILVGGDRDYRYRSSEDCFESKINPDDQGQGEDILLASQITFQLRHLLK